MINIKEIPFIMCSFVGPCLVSTQCETSNAPDVIRISQNFV